MIRRVDDKPKPVNPSGWISEGRMLTTQQGGNLVESGSTSIRESEPINPTLVQSPGPTYSQSSGQQLNDSDAESESELEDLNEIHRRGRLNRRVSDPGGFPHREPVSDRYAFFLLTPSVDPPQHNHLPSLHPPQLRCPSVTRTQTVEFAPSPQPRGRHQTKPSVDRSNKRQPSVAESRIQPSVSDGEGHVEVASKSSHIVSCRMWLTQFFQQDQRPSLNLRLVTHAAHLYRPYTMGWAGSLCRMS